MYNPYLLISKKRYAGLLWTKPEKWDKIDTKGIETVRRDNCLLVRNVVTTCLDLILVKRDPAAASEYVKGVIADLLQNKLDLSLLVISKARGWFFFERREGVLDERGKGGEGRVGGEGKKAGSEGREKKGGRRGRKEGRVGGEGDGCTG